MNNNITNMNIKQKSTLKKVQEIEKEQQLILDAADEWLDKTELHFSSVQSQYLIKIERDWRFIPQKSMKPRYPEWKGAFPEAVQVRQDEREWLHDDVTYSFRKDIPRCVFNMMDTSGWVQPSPGEHHWLFDVLIRSLGSGKPENIEHIEKVILYKYLHPENFRLPCLMIHGEGGVGKNLLVDSVLHTMFDGQTISAIGVNITGQFNSLAKGRTVVMINESVTDKADTAILKDMLHKERLVINEKGIRQFEVDNTPLYMIGSNEFDGGVYLDRSNADRRYSVLRCEQGKTLGYWIAEHLDISAADAEALLEREAAPVFCNRSEIAKWLNYLIEKYPGIEPPHALHGADYELLLNVQKKMEERLAESVFKDTSFTHIERKVLYEGYKLLCQVGSVNSLSDQKFYERIKKWLKANCPNIREKTIHTNRKSTNNGLDGEKRIKKSRTVWVITILDDIDDVAKKDNKSDYIEEDGSRPKWIGPDV